VLINITDIVDGALVNAIALTGRQAAREAATGLRDRRLASDLNAARWFETFRLTRTIPKLPELAPASRDQLELILNGDEVQACLQELLASRLTDAPETDASEARYHISRTLSRKVPEAASFAQVLTGYYDDQICDLVARLEASNPPLLAQIRSEAFSARIIAVLKQISRHTTALGTRPDPPTEERFLTSYRHHVLDRHGHIEPPDFDRRQRVPIADIYVPTGIVEDDALQQTVISRLESSPSLNIWTFAKCIDRVVLLGDPGGGKTTAASVLMHHFASDASQRLPFLVTLRDYAAKDPPERSVIAHIEHTLETFYQCRPPQGMIDLLLLSGCAVIIFDGLDELLDTSRRVDVTRRVEQFCVEYPLANVLVTSRRIGYEQAGLDERQFIRYRLAAFDPVQEEEYVRKWFARDASSRESDANTFLTESEGIPDLRSNPLMLALLCILYRGAGSLPRNRAEVYEECATLLFRKWDARRRIHQELRAKKLIEPALRHLAWWLFNQDVAKTAVTERSLVSKTTEFLNGRGFESEDDAWDAALEFVEFCRGRAWVFTDVGTDESGQKLYAFTHRTFLEYFAAAYLAYQNDTPEQLAATLLDNVTHGRWSVVAELAVQIKDRTSHDGAPRIYKAMLHNISVHSDEARAYLLGFLVDSLQSLDPSPQLIRQLTRLLLAETIKAGRSTNRSHDSTYSFNSWLDQWRDPSPWKNVLRTFFANCSSYRPTIVDEIENVLARLESSGDEDDRISSASLAASLTDAEELVQRQAALITTSAKTDAYVRNIALQHGLVTINQALEMPGELGTLLQSTVDFFNSPVLPPYLEKIFQALTHGWPAYSDPAIVEDLTAIGQYLLHHQEPPWLYGEVGVWNDVVTPADLMKSAALPDKLSQGACLAAAVLLAILIERADSPDWYIPTSLGPLRKLRPYLLRRRQVSYAILPDLPLPENFKRIFRRWAMYQINFTASEREGTFMPRAVVVSPLRHHQR
jgi:NACHT domain